MKSRFSISRPRSICLILCLGIWQICATAYSARAADDAIQVTDLKVGLDGSFRLGAWTSIEFDLTGPAGTVVRPVIRAVDPDGQGTLQPLAEATLTGDEPVRVKGLFRSGKLNAFLHLQLEVHGKPAVVVPLRVGEAGPYHALRQSTSIWVTVGVQPVFTRGLERWNEFVPGSAHHVDLPEFGNRIWSDAMLEGVDVIVVNGDVAIDTPTSIGLRDWVASGGRLIVAIGNTSTQFIESPFADWVQLSPSGQVDIAKLTGIQELVPRSSLLRTLSTIPAAQLDRRQGVVLASGLSGPLVMRSAYGAGQVTMVAIRLDEAPLSTWELDSQAKLISVLSGLPLPWENGQGTDARRGESDFDPSSVTDLQGQMNQSLDHFDGIKRAAPWAVIGWIALFAVVIGPLDYFLVRHWLRKPEWTWGTMALWTLLGSVVAISRANALNDHPEIARQIDSVDVDLTTNSVRGQSWFNFYSGANQRRKVTAQVNPEFLKAAPRSFSVSWVNRPGEGFRGMSGAGGMDETKPQYRFFEDLEGVDNFPVRKWSSGAVTCQWRIDATAETLVKSHLEEGGLNRLNGTIEHNLPGELTDWFLAYGNFSYFERPPVGETAKPLLPGTTWNVGQAGSNLLRGRLIAAMQHELLGKQTTAADDQLQRVAYNAESTDPRVSELVASFYQVLGGESYTGLRNESLRRLDLSETISLKRAVLFGKLKISPTLYQLDGDQLPMQNQSVMVRIILPVQQAVRDQDSPPPKEILQAPK